MEDVGTINSPPLIECGRQRFLWEIELAWLNTFKSQRLSIRNRTKNFNTISINTTIIHAHDHRILVFREDNFVWSLTSCEWVRYFEMRHFKCELDIIEMVLAITIIQWRIHSSSRESFPHDLDLSIFQVFLQVPNEQRREFIIEILEENHNPIRCDASLNLLETPLIRNRQIQLFKLALASPLLSQAVDRQAVNFCIRIDACDCYEIV